MKLPVRRRMVIPTVAAVAVVGGGSALLIGHGATGSSQYRTAVASLGTVTQTLLLSGNLSPVGESDLDFGSPGRVVAVNVTPGQTVTAGEALASIDSSTLQASLTQAQATLASAQARLSQDQAGPTAQSLAQGQASVRSAQNQLASAQTAQADSERVDQAAIAAAQATLANDQRSCAAQPAAATPTPTSTSSASPSPSSTSTPTPAPTAAPTPSPCSQVAAAQAALDAANAKAIQDTHQAQGQVSSAQLQLQNAQTALSGLQQGTTAQQIAMDQSQVQIDRINVDNAQNALSAATITAPVAGIVGQVNITVGQIASGSGSSASPSGSSGGQGAGSGSGTNPGGTHAIVVLDPGAFQVVGTVTDAQINEVAIGQAARVTVAGASQAIQGKVTGIAPEATVSSGVATFPVTVTLQGSNPSLHAGVSAAISLVIDQVTNVLTVPSSAIHPSGGGDTVQTLVDGQPQTVPVSVGASDPYRTQVLSGLDEGDTVVIATVSSVVPTPNASSFFGGGGRGGAGGGRGSGAGGAGGAVFRAGPGAGG